MPTIVRGSPAVPFVRDCARDDMHLLPCSRRSGRSLWRRRLTGVGTVCVGVAFWTVFTAAQGAALGPGLDGTLRALGDYADRYVSRAESILGTERITFQTLGPDLLPEGPGRVVVNDIHVEWGLDDAGELTGKVVREQVRARGRELECLDPPAVTPEPLAQLRASRHGDFIFTLARPTKLKGQPVRLLDYRARRDEAPTADFSEVAGRGCISVSMGSRVTGRIWMEESTGEVVRIEEHLIGPVTLRVPAPEQRRWGIAIDYERADTTIQYRRVRFSDPDETVLLPESIDSLAIARTTGISRVRVLREYSNYRRFVTGGRVVE